MHLKDEMEKSISNKALKISWSITMACLFLGGAFLFFKNNQEMNALLIIAIISTVSFLIAEQYHLSKTNEDRTFTKVVTIALITFIILIIILIFTSSL